MQDGATLAFVPVSAAGAPADQFRPVFTAGNITSSARQAPQSRYVAPREVPRFDASAKRQANDPVALVQAPT